jgi:L-iditol 2-dehydrogenase
MKFARYDSTLGCPVVLEGPIPEIGDEEILMKVMSAGVCGSELLTYRIGGGGAGSYGHEPAGYAAKVGREVRGVKEGDRIYVHHKVPCMVCHYCLKGNHTMCAQYPQFGLDPTAYAEYTRVKAPNVRLETVRLPDHVSFDAGCLIEPLSCVWRAMKRAGVGNGDTVMIIGSGFIGLSAIQIARVMGASIVVVSDFVDSKLDLAREMGADVVINPRRDTVGEALQAGNGGRKADVVMCVVESIKAFEQAAAMVDKGGTLLVFGPTEQGSVFSYPPNDFFFPEIRIVPSYGSAPYDTREVAHHLFQGNLKMEKLISHHYPLEKIAEALQSKKKVEDSIKIIIHPNGE